MYICRNESEEIRFRIETRSCAAMQEKDRYEHPPGKKEPRDIPAGTEVVPIAYSTVEGKDLSEYREPYYEALAKRESADG